MRKKEQQEIIQIMNILFFLTPKEDVAHVDEDDTMRQVCLLYTSDAADD